MATGPIVVTGATGFLGSWILSRLCDTGTQVTAVDLTCDSTRLSRLKGPETAATVDWRECDISDFDAVVRTVESIAPRAIVHLAALQIPACRNHPVLGARVNVVGHVNVLEAARTCGVKNVIYTSSIAAKPRGPANAPANLYGVFKRADEEIARIYWEDFGLPSLGLRPHIVYGVGRDDGETSAVTMAIRAAALGERYEMPFATRSCFQYAGEIAEIFIRCLENDWHGAVVSDLTTKIESTDDVINAIKDVAPDADIKTSSIERPSPIQGLDSGPLREIIGPWPQTTLRQGVGETFKMFRDLAEKSRLSKST